MKRLGPPPVIVTPEDVVNLGDRMWRLDNLYSVRNENGVIMPFRLRWVQRKLLEDMHNRNIILKSRQPGFSTFIMLYMLDACLFESNIHCGLVADTLPNARNLLEEKFYLPFDLLAPEIRGQFEIVERNKESCSIRTLATDNLASMDVGVSLRSGTFQILMVTELGPLSVTRPDKAKEVKTGALNTVHGTNRIFIESSGKGGQEGVFYEMVDGARGNPGPLTNLDFKFHFFAWWMDAKNQIEAPVHVDDAAQDYFAKLAAVGIRLTSRQKAWYVVKSREQGTDMKNEHPSTPDEAFNVTLEGTYYSQQMARMLEQGRITNVPVLPAREVHTIWDIGLSDDTFILFVQFVGNWIHVIDCYYNSGEQPEHYVEVLRARGYAYGGHWMPHDIKVKLFGMEKTRVEQFVAMGIQPEITPNIGKADGINLARKYLDRMIVDGDTCAQWLKCMRNYRKEWDSNRGVFKNEPRHDWASHGADAGRYLAVMYEDGYGEARTDAPPRDTHNITGATMEELMKPTQTKDFNRGRIR